MNLGGGAFSEPGSRHCIPAWVTQRDSMSKKNNKNNNNKNTEARGTSPCPTPRQLCSATQEHARLRVVHLPCVNDVTTRITETEIP